jgi:folate-binding protein YgfZ
MPSPLPIEGVCRLSGQGLVRAFGPDAAAFLQGQLTNDVLSIGTGRARLAGFCSAKGRLQATFVVWSGGAEEFFLVCPAGILAATLKRLSMFVLRAKCKLTDASAEIALWGVAGAPAEALTAGAEVWDKRDVSGTGTVIRLPDGASIRRALVATPAGSDAAPVAAPPLSLDAWRWLEVESGIVAIEATTVDRFVPQMVNFERVGGVDFQKGCYPGQEVVARSQYRGTTKRRTFLFDCDVVPEAGQDVFAAGETGEPAGTVANAAPRPAGVGGSALVELRLAALAAPSLHLGAPDGPVLRPSELPYPLALEPEAAA